MGQKNSSPNYDVESLWLYNKALEKPCLLPDVGLDESLLTYSGIDSNAVLKVFSDDLVNTVPDYVSSFGSAIAPLTLIPNAVGLGALVLSLIMEICIKSSSQKDDDDAYSLLRRVFGEEKASSVRDKMSEYLKRHRMYLNNTQTLREEIRRLEPPLSEHLTILRNSLMHDGQMSSRGFKIWINGAAFHVQMLIHEARLAIQTDKPASDYLNAIEATINSNLQDLDNLLEKYKTYKINFKILRYRPSVVVGSHIEVYHPSVCVMMNNENKSCRLDISYKLDCSDQKMATAFMDTVYSNYEPIKGLKSYFLNIKKNLNSLIHEDGSFTVLPAAG